MKLTLMMALLFAVVPTLALAAPKTTAVRARQQEYRDRTPKAHVHTPRPHQNA